MSCVYVFCTTRHIRICLAARICLAVSRQDIFVDTYMSCVYVFFKTSTCRCKPFVDKLQYHIYKLFVNTITNKIRFVDKTGNYRQKQTDYRLHARAVFFIATNNVYFVLISYCFSIFQVLLDFDTFRKLRFQTKHTIIHKNRLITGYRQIAWLLQTDTFIFFAIYDAHFSPQGVGSFSPPDQPTSENFMFRPFHIDISMFTRHLTLLHQGHGTWHPTIPPPY